MYVRFYCLLLCLYLSGCSHLIFYPTKKHFVTTEKLREQLHIEVKDVFFTSGDNLRLHGWFVPSQIKAKGTVMFVHGNAENISSHLKTVWWLPKYGFNVFLFDYRGYGYSQGSPSLPGVHEDLMHALDTLMGMEHIDTEKVVVFGQSLGGAIAINQLATSPHRDHIRALIVASTFTSFRTVARQVLANFWLTWLIQWPLSLTISDDYPPLDAIPHISPIPILILHGEQDSVISPLHARALFAAAREPKAMWLLPNVGHNNLFNNPDNQERLVEYLQQAVE